MNRTRDQLMYYYLEELRALQREGTAFAHAYPKVARRLGLGPGGVSDPHVERLLQGFAFLTGRLRHELESEFPQISAAMLEVLNPNYTAPLPSMSVACFQPTTTQGRLLSPYTIPRGTRLFASAQTGETVRFRTCYDVELQALAVRFAAIEDLEGLELPPLKPLPVTSLRVQLASLAGGMAEQAPRRLRFHLNADPVTAFQLYELLFSEGVHVAVPDTRLGRAGRARLRVLHGARIEQVGFRQDEGVLPLGLNAHVGTRLLQEYFAFPEKFLFLDVHLPEGAFADVPGEQAQLYFLLPTLPDRRFPVLTEVFALGCTPIVNLFTRLAEPLRLTRRASEYRVVADIRRERSTEVHTVLQAELSSVSTGETRPVVPLHSYSHAAAQRDTQVFWLGRRTPSLDPNRLGSDLRLALVDLNLQFARVPDEVLRLRVMCTNRHLAEEVPAGARMEVEEALPVDAIVCLRAPTDQVDPPTRGALLWRLISQLSLNHLSLTGDPQSLDALREILLLYADPHDPSHVQQVQGIRGVSSREVVRRIGRDAWRGFCRGLEITLRFDESMYTGSSAFLMGSVLEQFMARYATVNTFTHVLVRSEQREGIWKEWPVRAGEQIVL
ncbi:MAG: type VI secretion system baseplate subunit TssF [Alphaproteobacteria bacterium]|nr:type VI secretion system baseplate subunit TssF [Alphaproteobacteria bacterium]